MFKKEKGVILYLALIILTIGMAVVLGLSTILVGQIKTIEQMENSMRALFAADTGMERALYGEEGNPDQNYSGSLDGASYETNVFCSPDYPRDPEYPDEPVCPLGIEFIDDDCAAYFFCYYSMGTCQNTQRKLEAVR